MDQKTRLDLRRLYALLRRTEPIAGEYDVVWGGPMFVRGRRGWFPTRFQLYGGHLYCGLDLGTRAVGLTWKLGSSTCTVESRYDWYEAERLWKEAVPQLDRKLRLALGRPRRYEALMKRMPVECRTGKIERRLTWPPGPRPLPESKVAQIEPELGRAAEYPGPREMTVETYLRAAAVAYDAAFAKARKLTPWKKYERFADRRHGGMMDLPPRNARAFRRWFTSRAWQGAHPWEIVFAHPHGIMLSPLLEAGRWRVKLWVDTEGLYVTAAKMALALAKRKYAVDFLNAKEVIDAIRGVDLVEVGPHIDQISFEELRKAQRGAEQLVRWDPLPSIKAISKTQLARVRHVERFGNPSGFELPPAVLG